MRKLIALTILFSQISLANKYDNYLKELDKKYETWKHIDGNEPFSTGNGSNILYGGQLGGQLYQKYTKNFIKPALSDYLRHIKEQETLNKKALISLMLKLGQWRNLIAISTQSQNSSEFGKLAMAGQMMVDPVFENSNWSKWKKRLLEKIINCINSFDWIDSESIFTDNKETLKVSVDYITNNIAQMRLRGNNNINAGGSYKIYMELGIREKTVLTSEQQLKSLKSVNDDILNLSNKIRTVEFQHTGHKFDGNNVNDFMLFKNALFWQETDGIESLTSLIAEILWKLSHSTTYLRGQAAITQWLINALANFHNFDLVKITELPLDQEALLYLDLDKFLDNINNIIILEPEQITPIKLIN